MSISTDVDGGVTTDGTRVQIWSKNTSAAQKWKFGLIATLGGENASAVLFRWRRQKILQPLLKVYPNPVTDGILYVDLSSSAMASSSIFISDMTGKNVYSVSKSLAKGFNRIRINVTMLSAGMYILQIKHSNKIEQYTMIKK